MTKRLPRDPQKEKAILKAAIAAFGVDGYRAGTDKIAAAANVSKGSVFRYFDSKQKLYVAAVHQAMTTLTAVADLNVWTASDDLVSMIIRATKYKTELSHQYPHEFALLTRVYAHDEQVPEKLRTEAFSILNTWAQQAQSMIINQVVDKLSLRPELDKKVVKRFLSITIQEISRQIQSYFEQYPEIKRMEDMTEIVNQVKTYMDILEHGIVK